MPQGLKSERYGKSQVKAAILRVGKTRAQINLRPKIGPRRAPPLPNIFSYRAPDLIPFSNLLRLLPYGISQADTFQMSVTTASLADF